MIFYVRTLTITISTNMLRNVFRYRIRKIFRGIFNFMVFVDDKDPRNFFHDKSYITRNLLHFILTSRVQCTN